MSVRRRRIKERVERDLRRTAGALELTYSLQRIQDAITSARERGETEVTERFLREAFVLSRKATGEI